MAIMINSLYHLHVGPQWVWHVPSRLGKRIRTLGRNGFSLHGLIPGESNVLGFDKAGLY